MMRGTEEEPEPDRGIWSMVWKTAFFFFALWVLLPYSIQFAFGDNISPTVLLGVCVLVGLPGAAFTAYEMSNNMRHSMKLRREQRANEAVKEQTYKCIQPQILDSLAVFPVRVVARGAAASKWLSIEDEFVTMEMVDAFTPSGKKDTEGALKRLAEKTFGSNFQVLVFCGDGKAGPTGLAVGIGRVGFGEELSRTVAKLIMNAVHSGLTAQ